MTTSETGQADGSTWAGRVMGILDRAWDGTWVLRLLYLTLLLDMAMLGSMDFGLLQWSMGDKALLNNLGWIVSMLVGLSVAAAIVTPVVVAVVHQILLIVWFSGWFRWFARWFEAEYRPYQRPLGRVPAHAFRDLALRERDAFLYRIYESHAQRMQSAKRAREQTGGLVVVVVIAALADWFLVQSVPGGVGLIGATIKALGEGASIAVSGGVFYAGVILHWAWFSDPPRDEIYYPPLDAELRRKEREVFGMPDREPPLRPIRS